MQRNIHPFQAKATDRNRTPAIRSTPRRRGCVDATFEPRDTRQFKRQPRSGFDRRRPRVRYQRSTDPDVEQSAHRCRLIPADAAIVRPATEGLFFHAAKREQDATPMARRGSAGRRAIPKLCLALQQPGPPERRRCRMSSAVCSTSVDPSD